MDEDHKILIPLLFGAIVGLLVAVVGSFFDPNSDNKYAKLAGLVVFVLVFLSLSGFLPNF